MAIVHKTSSMFTPGLIPYPHVFLSSPENDGNQKYSEVTTSSLLFKASSGCPSFKLYTWRWTITRKVLYISRICDYKYFFRDILCPLVLRCRKIVVARANSVNVTIPPAFLKTNTGRHYLVPFSFMKNLSQRCLFTSHVVSKSSSSSSSTSEQQVFTLLASKSNALAYSALTSTWMPKSLSELKFQIRS